MKKILFFAALCVFSTTACTKPEDSIAVIWTDCTDFIPYCNAFNAAQDDYKITVSYKENPADALINAVHVPDIVISSWLKGDAARVKFTNLNHLLSEKKIAPDIFYPSLLELGNVNKTQYLLPVSFNLPAIIFSVKHKDLPKNNFTLSLEEMRELALTYNEKKAGEYSKMGFSPRWDIEFLYVTAQGMNASFEETQQLFSWNDQALQKTLAYIRKWTETVNTSAAMEDEFKFRYLYDPPHTLIESGRCLFWYLPSNELFSLQHEKLKNLDYRWMSYNNKTPLQDTILYAGICKNGKNKTAAEAFLLWFFNEESQKQLLMRTQADNRIVPAFGLAGGFSSLRNVTEDIFPVYYPLLLKHLPQTDDFSPPHILPNNWEQLKREILFPYLKDQTKDFNEESKSATLNRRISDWHKKTY